MIGLNDTRRRHETARVFGIDTTFDGVSAERQVILGKAQPLAICNSDLLAHKVDAGNHFRDGMLNLQACIHFDEIKFAVFIEKLDCSDPRYCMPSIASVTILPIAARAAESRTIEGALPEPFGGGVARAVALAQMHGIACESQAT